MKLTKYQLKFLRAWLHYYHFGCTFSQWFRLSWKVLLFFAVMLVFSILIATAIPMIGWVCFAFYLGTVLRDFTYFRLGRRRWPVVLDVVNWDRVQQLVDAHEKPVTTK